MSLWIISDWHQSALFLKTKYKSKEDWLHKSKKDPRICQAKYTLNFDKKKKWVLSALNQELKNPEIERHVAMHFSGKYYPFKGLWGKHEISNAIYKQIFTFVMNIHICMEINPVTATINWTSIFHQPYHFK